MNLFGSNCLFQLINLVLGVAIIGSATAACNLNGVSVKNVYPRAILRLSVKK